MKKLLLYVVMLCSYGIANAQLNLGQPDNMEMCSNSDFGTFDLTLQIPAVLNGLSADDYTVTFHHTLVWAQNDIEAIFNPQSYTNTANPQTIYIRVEQSSNSEIYDIAEFSVMVNISPSVLNQGYNVCDNDDNPSDGLTLINLQDVAQQIWANSGYTPNTLEIDFYGSQSDAVNQTQPLSDPYQMTAGNHLIWIRSHHPGESCFTISLVELNVLNCNGSCATPAALFVTNITSTGATLGWNAEGAETQWEILVLFSGGPFPLPTMNGIIVELNPFILTGLECSASYDVYIRALCAGEISDWSQPVTFSTQNCGTTFGEPDNLIACAENGTACFDLTVNDDNVLGNLDPAAYTVTYHLSAANANADTNPISNPTEYCTTVAMGADEIFIRIENNQDGTFEVVWFTVTAQEITMGDPLTPLMACDENGDNLVMFDLTSAGAELNTDNALQYYATDGNAFSQQNPIANPGQYSVNTTSPITTIYIREDVVGGCDIIYTVQLNASADCDLSNICAGANSLCNAFGEPFANAINSGSAEAGNDYGCLGSTPNPIWFYLPVSSSGNISLKIEQSATINFEQSNIDVDFVVYGPFADPVTPCSGMLTEANIVDCSYSAAPIEYPLIENAVAGEYYILLVTNFMNQPGFIRITETPDSVGEISCMGFRLNAFIDANSNSIKDAGEVNFAMGQFHYEVNNNAVVHHITSPTGVHTLYENNVADSYDLSYSVNPEYAAFFNVSIPSYSDVSVVAGAGLQHYDFPITVIESFHDVSVTIIPNNAPRPGFAYTNTVAYTNHGTQTVSGTLAFHKDPAVTIISNSQAGVVPTATGFSYAYTNLQPFETRMIYVTMLVPTIPTVQLGDMLTSTAEIGPTAGDVVLQNNSSVSTQEIIGSYDPNDKMESRGDQIVLSEFSDDDYLYYTVRFENTGTASAINVRIEDALDGTLDFNTVRMIDASHDYVLDRVGNQLVWRFDNILLPPTMDDPDESEGYVHFKVKPLPGYGVGDVIPNTASIFFDFNPAIVTNTFTSTFVTSLAVDEFETSSLIIYPNPSSDFVIIAVRNAGDHLTKVIVYDITGQMILTKNASLATEIIDMSAAAPGLYLIEITTLSGKTIKKLMIE